MFSHNEEELIQWGQRLGKLLQAGDVLVLTGDLGREDTFTKGLALGLGISQMIKKPNLYHCSGIRGAFAALSSGCLPHRRRSRFH